MKAYTTNDTIETKKLDKNKKCSSLGNNPSRNNVVCHRATTDTYKYHQYNLVMKGIFSKEWLKGMFTLTEKTGKMNDI